MGTSNFCTKWEQPAVRALTFPKLALLFFLLLFAASLWAREKDATQYGMGLIVNVPYPEGQVIQVVRDVVQNGLIRGTREYNKDEYVSGANAADSTRAFKPWTESGTVFYKVRNKALDPQNFRNGGDVGTLAVRYVLQPQGDKNTVLRIDAIFVEDFRRASHPSNGSVEAAEYKDIHDRLESMAAMKAQAVEEEKEKQKSSDNPITTITAPDVPADPPKPVVSDPPAVQPGAAPPQAQTLAQHVQDLRHQVERLVKAPGAPLKSAPFHTASTIESLPASTEVLIVISTPYWLGVETHDGHRGWMLRDDLETLP